MFFLQESGENSSDENGGGQHDRGGVRGALRVVGVRVVGVGGVGGVGGVLGVRDGAGETCRDTANIAGIVLAEVGQGLAGLVAVLAVGIPAVLGGACGS